jgi:hypothetical protein
MMKMPERRASVAGNEKVRSAPSSRDIRAVNVNVIGGSYRPGFWKVGEPTLDFARLFAKPR